LLIPTWIGYLHSSSYYFSLRRLPFPFLINPYSNLIWEEEIILTNSSWDFGAQEFRKEGWFKQGGYPQLGGPFINPLKGGSLRKEF